MRVTVDPDVRSHKFDVTTETVARLKVVDDRLGLALLLGKPPSKGFIRSAVGPSARAVSEASQRARLIF